MKGKITYFTVCNIQYLPKAIVLAKSLYNICNAKLIIYIFDKETDIIPFHESYEIRWVANQGIPNFQHIAFMYDVTEACTSVKPYLTLQLLEKFNSAIYLDPDICIYSDLSELTLLLEKYPILLTPHYITPIDDQQFDYDLSMMRFGSFNLGFYGVNDSEEGIRFLKWWSERCINLGFAEAQFGLSVDQKWVSIAPCFFENIKIIFDMGYNMAFWNLHERQLSSSNSKYLVNNKYILRFFHYSSFNINNPEVVSTRPLIWNKTGREDLSAISIKYAEALKENDFGLSKIKYAYDYLSNGDYISPVLRRAYASVYKELNINHDPFDSNGFIRKFIKNNHLREKNNIIYKPMYESNLSGYSWQFKFINFIFRIILRFVGPNMFVNYSRLLVYLSSYRKNRKLWKL
jgi:hypothetical protein